MSSLLNRAKTKEFALALSETTRGGKFTRVGKPFLDRLEAKFKNMVHEEVRQHPSMGVTLL